MWVKKSRFHSVFGGVSNLGWESNLTAALTSQPAAGHSLSFYDLFYDLGLRPISGAGHKRLQPNLAPISNIFY